MSRAANSNRNLLIMMVSAVALLVAGVFSAVTFEDDGSLVTASGSDTDEPDVVDFGQPSGDDEDDDDEDDGEVPATVAPDPQESSDVAVAGDQNEANSATTAPAETEKASATSTSGPSTTSTTTTAPTTTTTVAPTTTAAPTTTQPSGGSGGDARDGFSPAPAGTYTYDTNGTASVAGNTSDLPEETTLTVRAPQGDTQVFVRDLRDASGDGSVTETTYRLTDAGVELLEITTTFNVFGSSQTSTLTTEGTYVIIPNDVAAGTVTKGRLTGDGLTADVTVTVRSIDDEEMDVLIDTQISGEAEGYQRSETVFNTADLLMLSEDVESEISSGGFTLTSDYTAVLAR